MKLVLQTASRYKELSMCVPDFLSLRPILAQQNKNKLSSIKLALLWHGLQLPFHTVRMFLRQNI